MAWKGCCTVGNRAPRPSVLIKWPAGSERPPQPGLRSADGGIWLLLGVPGLSRVLPGGVLSEAGEEAVLPDSNRTAYETVLSIHPIVSCSELAFTAGTRGHSCWLSFFPDASLSGRCSPRALLFCPMPSEAGNKGKRQWAWIPSLLKNRLRPRPTEILKIHIYLHVCIRIFLNLKRNTRHKILASWVPREPSSSEIARPQTWRSPGDPDGLTEGEANKQTRAEPDQLEEVIPTALGSWVLGLCSQKPKWDCLRPGWSSPGARATEPGGHSRRQISRELPGPAGSEAEWRCPNTALWLWRRASLGQSLQFCFRSKTLQEGGRGPETG